MHKHIEDQFKKDGRPKALVLEGPTGVGTKNIYNINSVSTTWFLSFLFRYENLGKTSFALSLSGVPNHVCGHFSREDWKDDADYMILDNIDWPNWDKKGFPNPRELLTGQSHITVRIYVFS